MSYGCGLWVIIPEIIIFSAVLLILLTGSFCQSKKIFISLLVACSALAAYFVFTALQYNDQFAFGDLYLYDGFAKVAKLIIISLLFIITAVSRAYLKFCEYLVLLLCVTLGMLLSVSANDLILLYLSFELQSLALYILVAIDREKIKSLEAGVKYFVLSSVASAIAVYGVSLIYGFAGTTNFSQLAQLDLMRELPVILGFTLLLTGILFKVSAVPFHIWTPDVYSGAPTEITMLLATMSKFTGALILIRLFSCPFKSLHNSQIIVFLAMASIILGSLGAMKQQSIKRFMAYSSISHIGYILLALVTATENGFVAATLYVLIYLISAVGMFTLIIYLGSNYESDYSIEELSRRASGNSFLSFAAAIFMLSMAGLPPLVGFFAKFYVFMPLVQSKMFVVAIVAVIMSILSIAYYLRVVKIVCFSKMKSADLGVSDRSGLLFCIIFLAALLNIVLFVMPNVARNVVVFMTGSLGC